MRSAAARPSSVAVVTVPSDLMGCAASSSAVMKPMKSPTVLMPLAMRQ